MVTLLTFTCLRKFNKGGMTMPDEKPKKDDRKIRAERFYEDDPEGAFEIISKGKPEKKEDDKKE